MPQYDRIERRHQVIYLRALSILVAHLVRDRGRPADSTRAFIGNAALFETQKACRDSGDFSDMYLAPLDTDFRVEVDVVADVWTNPWTAGAYLVTCGILPMVAREDFAVHARLRRQDGSVVAECDCSSSYRVVATILLLPAGPFLHSDSPVYDCVLQSLALARAKGVL
jgi:hypothetical protein